MYIPKFYEVLFGIYLYILELQNGKYYVGISRNPECRFREHRYSQNRTSEFVRQHRPVKRAKLKLLDTTDWRKAENIETNKTIELIQIYGIENVYGGAITGDLDIRIRKFKNHLNKH